MTIKVFPLSQTRAGFEELYLRRLFQCHVSWAGTHRKLTWIPKIAICERCYMFETIILTIYFANLQIARASLCLSDPTRKWPEDFSITRSRRFPLRLRWGRINWYDGPPAKKKKTLGNGFITDSYIPSCFPLQLMWFVGFTDFNLAPF